MQSSFRNRALHFRSEVVAGRVTPATFTAALEEVPPQDRDEWLNVLWDIDEIPSDDPDLPRGCVPYLPCEVATVLEVVHQAAVTRDDVFIDVGSGIGRAALLAHLKTGASCIGLEIQPALVRIAQGRADSLRLNRMRFFAGDAADMVPIVTVGTVFFLYCPFGADRLGRFLGSLEGVARSRSIRVCCVDMPRLEVPWLARLTPTSVRIDVYESTVSI